MSKEEIEKAKGWLSALDIKSEFEAILKETLLQYIEQLEDENSKLNKILKPMAEEICIHRAYAITRQNDIEKLKERIIQEYKEKVEKG